MPTPTVLTDRAVPFAATAAVVLSLALAFTCACGSSTSATPADAGALDDASASDALAPGADAAAPGLDAGDASTLRDASPDAPGEGGVVSPLPPKNVRTFGAACDGVTDDRDAFAKGIAAAAGNALNLQIDATCTLFIKVGTDVTKPVFFEDGTTVQVLPGGKIIVDDISIPTFNLVDTVGVTLIDWNVHFVGSLPVDSSTWVGGKFNDTTLKTYLEKSRNVSFPTNDAGTASALWASPTNTSAMFDLRGQTSQVSITGMTLTGGATGDTFIPMAFSMTPEAKRGQVIYRDTPVDGTAFAIPDSLTFSNIALDGTYFGWQGQSSNSTYSHITSLHYGDMQDSSGGNVGGCPTDGGSGGCALAPPHLFYFNERAQPDLSPSHNTITDVLDKGLRVGVARLASSGNASSIKFGGVDSTLNGYTSYRPDGLMDVLSSTNNVIENVTATYDSTFCQNAYPIIRFPGSLYTNLTMKGLILSDTAASTDHAIFPGDDHPTAIVKASVSGVQVTMNAWTGAPRGFVGAFSGTDSNTQVSYAVGSTPEAASVGQVNAVTFQLFATPSTVATGASTTLTWSTTGATSCTAGGGPWSGAKAASGTEMVPLTTQGSTALTLTCTDGVDTAVATVTVTAQ